MFKSSVWDRLTTPTDTPSSHKCPPHEKEKRAITRDVEALLNSRSALSEEELADYPFCRDSIVNFGLTDFAQLCLTSSADRDDLCNRLKKAIERHEPRLNQVEVQLMQTSGGVNRLDFIITGLLRASGTDERIQFGATLERSRLHYEVR